MKQRDSLLDRIMARIKSNPVTAVLVAAGTVVIALSTFSDATRNLLGLLKRQSPETARRELSDLAVEYTRQAFAHSAKQGDIRAVKLFLAAGMDPNAKDDEGNTALMNAIAQNRTEIIKALLKAKAKVNEKNYGGATALSWAAAGGQLDTVRLLVDQGADAQTINEAFVTAAEDAHPDVMPALLEKGAKLNELGSKALLRAAGSTVVGAADQDRSDTVRFLLSLGVDVNAKDEDGWTALLLAAEREDDRSSVVRTLVDRGADVNAKCACPRYESGGWTALMLASRRGHDEIVRILVAKHADVNMKNNLGQTSLALAATAIEDNVDVVRTLLDAGANGDAQDIRQRTPLMEAAQWGHVKVVRTLLERGVRVDAKEIHGKTALQLVKTAILEGNATEGRKEVVGLLSKAGSK